MNPTTRTAQETNPRRCIDVSTPVDCAHDEVNANAWEQSAPMSAIEGNAVVAPKPNKLAKAPETRTYTGDVRTSGVPSTWLNASGGYAHAQFP
jgi:hypothetical protein